MYKLTMLFFFLTVCSSQGLIDHYKIIFDNENASYTLQIEKDCLVFENNQPNVSVIEVGTSGTNTDKNINAAGKFYKITKGATFEEGLKIGGEDVIDIGKIGAEDIIVALREMNRILFDEKNHQAYEIMLTYDSVTVVEKSSKMKTVFPIEDGVYLNVSEGKFCLVR